MTHGPNKTQFPCGDLFDMALNAWKDDANCFGLNREPKVKFTCPGCIYRFDYLPL